MELFKRLKRFWRPRQIHHMTEARFIPHATLMRAIPYWPEGLEPDLKAVVLIEAMYQLMQKGAVMPYDRVAGSKRSLSRVTGFFYQLYQRYPKAPEGTNLKLNEIIRLTAAELNQMFFNPNHPHYDASLYPYPDVSWKLEPGIGYCHDGDTFRPSRVPGHTVVWPVFYIDRRRVGLDLIISELHDRMRKLGADDVMIAKLGMEPTLSDVLPPAGNYDEWLTKQSKYLVTYYGGK